MITYVFRIDSSEFDHENGLRVVPFPNAMEALDFAAEVAESIDPELWKEACEDFTPTDYRTALDYFNDRSLAIGGELVKMQSGNNSKEFMLAGSW